MQTFLIIFKTYLSIQLSLRFYHRWSAVRTAKFFLSNHRFQHLAGSCFLYILQSHTIYCQWHKLRNYFSLVTWVGRTTMCWFGGRSTRLWRPVCYRCNRRSLESCSHREWRRLTLRYVWHSCLWCCARCSSWYRRFHLCLSYPPRIHQKCKFDRCVQRLLHRSVACLVLAWLSTVWWLSSNVQQTLIVVCHRIQQWRIYRYRQLQMTWNNVGSALAWCSPILWFEDGTCEWCSNRHVRCNHLFKSLMKNLFCHIKIIHCIVSQPAHDVWTLQRHQNVIITS